jgi:hypothetical protein
MAGEEISGIEPRTGAEELDTVDEISVVDIFAVEGVQQALGSLLDFAEERIADLPVPVKRSVIPIDPNIYL